VAVPLSCLLLAVRAPAVAVAAAAFTAGAGITLSGTFWQTAMQKRVPAALLARLASGVVMCFVPAVTRVRWHDGPVPGAADDGSFAAAGAGYLGRGQAD
jgi:hypothetical protein